MAEAPVTLDEFRDHLNLDSTDTYDDGEMTSTLSAATDVVESYVGAMVPVEVVETVVSVGNDGRLLTKRWPVIEVTDVTDVTSSTPDPTGAGQIWYLGSTDYVGRYTVTYTAGRDPVPEALREATLIVARQLWDRQRSSGPQVSLTGMGGQDNPVRMGFAVPAAAVELMAPYRLFSLV